MKHIHTCIPVSDIFWNKKNIHTYSIHSNKLNAYSNGLWYDCRACPANNYMRCGVLFLSSYSLVCILITYIIMKKIIAFIVWILLVWATYAYTGTMPVKQVDIYQFNGNYPSFWRSWYTWYTGVYMNPFLVVLDTGATSWYFETMPLYLAKWNKLSAVWTVGITNSWRIDMSIMDCNWTVLHAPVYQSLPTMAWGVSLAWAKYSNISCIKVGYTITRASISDKSPAINMIQILQR